jgi:spermidine synthase
MRLSPYKDLSGALRYPGAQIVATDWDQGTRVDLVVSDGIRSLPGLSLAYTGRPPRQDGVTFDGDDLSPVSRLDPADAEFAHHLLGSLAFRLRPDADVLVLEPRGGLDVLVALAHQAESVVAVEPHAAAVHAVRANGPSPYDDPRVAVVFATPRTYVERTDQRFDVIDLALTSPYRPVASGAYSLAEDYRLTVDAFEQYLERLAPGGIFTATRWVQTPPSEETRLLATAVEALRRLGVEPSDTVVMLRSYSAAALLVQPDGFSRAELDQIAAFAVDERFDFVAAPGLDPETTNRFNVVPDEQYSRLASDLLAAPDTARIYRSHDFEIAAATDDRPFFGHYFKWSQAATVRASLGRTWQPFGGAGYFVLLALLAISTVAALALIVAPLFVGRRTKASTPPRLRWWTVGYFGLIGIAFLFIEIPLIQQYILVIGQPATAFAVVVSAILAASGLGSAWSRRIAWRPAAIALAGTAVAYPFLVRWLTPVVLPAPTLLRMVAVALMVAPLGFLMGIMFPQGLAHLEDRAPQLVPWAWGINGTVSVISAVAAAILALSFGFSVVVQMGAVAYGGAALLARPRVG